MAACWYKSWIPASFAGHVGIGGFTASRQQCSASTTAASSADLGEKAYTIAERLHSDGDDRAVDYWAQCFAWMDDALKRTGHSRCQLNETSHCGLFADPMVRVSQVQHSAMNRILTCGQAYGRLEPSSHLLINGAIGAHRIPVLHQGFAWKQNDFDRLLVFSPPLDSPGNVAGRGLPLVVLSPAKTCQLAATMSCDCNNAGSQTDAGCEQFLNSRTPFAATALFHLPVWLFEETEGSVRESHDGLDAPSVTFVNPLALDSTDPCNAIAQSPAMPLIYARESNQYNPITAFINGDNGIDRPELVFLEPYQADKIPLIMVHGLISNPATFLEMADAIRADPLLRTRYQIWVFRYPTGDGFLASAAVLRKQLAMAFSCHHAGQWTSGDTNPSQLAHRAVIVGHSMGGLLSKLQVTDSGDQLWRSVAKVPLEQLQASPRDLARLRSTFFFQANPNIGRVVYLATPHEGSPWASRCIGRMAANLASESTPDEKDYQALVARNPGVFADEISASMPSSVELLRPSSALLQRLASIQPSSHVVANSIIGDRFPLPRAGASDGVVPVKSALRTNAESNLLVNATHTSILRSSEAEQELLRILTLHLATPTTAPSAPSLVSPKRREIGTLSWHH